MNLKHLLVVACFVTGSMTPAIAQEQTRLRFDLSIDGSIVASPELTVTRGREGRLELSERYAEERIAFTPTARGDSITVALTITDGDRQFRPTVVIAKDAPGFIQWTSSAQGQAIRLMVTLLE